MTDDRTLYVDRPEPGTYQMRLVKGGPWCPVRIYVGFGLDPLTGEEIERAWTLRAIVAEAGQVKERDPYQVWTTCADEPIAAWEFEYLLAMQRHAVQFEPSMPEANPRQKVDWSSLRFDFTPPKG